ncbi:adenosylhomocysteinase [Acrocarpospora corrugata]|uniref:Adenosylhomocysteinase n=1 Tax=Acrocarpospora corrugata TaxID=35763 RepID=A0A5M3WHJ2_9ACTN|nr:adenosylhomocysteinase [Acrocarpospora corrugata]GES05798.1 adenosylhomocysteinase [Acrocarpospora corrugata]
MVITHVLPGQMDFLTALNRVTPVAAVLPKPKSADQPTLEEAARRYRCDALARSRFADPGWLATYLADRAAGRPLVLADIGGYYAPALAAVCSALPGKIAGVVEDTENGLRRYLALGVLPCPVYSVARSPLKEPEDRLVGDAIVFSIESLLRRLGQVLAGRRACVLGFGKIGAGIAAALHARHAQVSVVETDPIRQAQAISIGYGSAPLPCALGAADLVVSATGSRAIGVEHLEMLRDDAVLAGATSADDEFDLADLHNPETGFTREALADGAVRYRRTDRSFVLLGNGNAVNFLHTSAVGPAIHLIKAEIIAAMARLVAERHEPGLYEVPDVVRTRIAATWVDAFSPHAAAAIRVPAGRAAKR